MSLNRHRRPQTTPDVQRHVFITDERHIRLAGHPPCAIQLATSMLILIDRSSHEYMLMSVSKEQQHKRYPQAEWYVHVTPSSPRHNGNDCHTRLSSTSYTAAIALREDGRRYAMSTPVADKCAVRARRRQRPRRRVQPRFHQTPAREHSRFEHTTTTAVTPLSAAIAAHQHVVNAS